MRMHGNYQQPTAIGHAFDEIKSRWHKILKTQRSITQMLNSGCVPKFLSGRRLTFCGD